VSNNFLASKVGRRWDRIVAAVCAQIKRDARRACRLGWVETLAKYFKERVSADVDYIIADELAAYPKALRLSGHDAAKHRTVNHSAEIYADGDVTTNGIESAFSLFKRGVKGSFHKIFDKTRVSSRRGLMRQG
jgi:ISXO2-like transposase domain